MGVCSPRPHFAASTCLGDGDRDRILVHVKTDLGVHFRHERSPIQTLEAPHRPSRLRNGHPIYLFVGSEAGGRAAATAYTLIETAKLNGVDPQAWLADTLARIHDYKITRVDDFLPWNRAK